MTCPCGYIRDQREYYNRLAEQQNREYRRVLENIRNDGAVQEDTKQLIMRKVMQAQQAVQEAYQVALARNVLAAEVPAVRRLQELGRELSAAMQALAKVRGL